jgi:amino acid transporter
MIGNFRWNVVLAAASRLIAYALVCAALIALRRKRPSAAAYRLPMGNVFAVAGVGIMLAIFTRLTREELAWILATAVIAFLHWLATRRHVVAGAAT